MPRRILDCFRCSPPPSIETVFLQPTITLAHPLLTRSPLFTTPAFCSFRDGGGFPHPTNPIARFCSMLSTLTPPFSKAALSTFANAHEPRRIPLILVTCKTIKNILASSLRLPLQTQTKELSVGL